MIRAYGVSKQVLDGKHLVRISNLVKFREIEGRSALLS